MPTMQEVETIVLLMARIGSVFAFVPIPGFKGTPPALRALVVLALTLMLYPHAQVAAAAGRGIGGWALAILHESGFGLAAGLVVSLLSESMVFGLQGIAIQAGFSYASTIDPSTEADSGVLQILAQLIANLLFFQFGGMELVLRATARSLAVLPLGSAHVTLDLVGPITHFGSAMLELGVRLSLPIAALLLLTDLSLALMGRIQPQLQLLTLAFPVKALGTLLAIAMLAPVMPVVFRAAHGHAARCLAAWPR